MVDKNFARYSHTDNVLITFISAHISKKQVNFPGMIRRNRTMPMVWDELLLTRQMDCCSRGRGGGGGKNSCQHSTLCPNTLYRGTVSGVLFFFL